MCFLGDSYFIGQSREATAYDPAQIRYRDIDSISPNPRNARTHTSKQISQIAASIREFGFVGAIIINKAGMILAGHARYEALKLLNLKSVPTISLDHLTKEQQRAYVLEILRHAQILAQLAL